jgi:hypothetical protein
MNRLIKYSLICVALWASVRIIILLFFYDQLPISFLASEFSQDQMEEYRARVLLPAFFLTLNYFIYRFFAGKNPTSPLWPIYVISVSLIISHIIGFITFLPLTRDSIIMFLICCYICFVAKTGHNSRKNEIF